MRNMDNWHIRKQAGFWWHLRPDAPSGLVDRMLDLHKGTPTTARIIKQNPIRTVFALEVDGVLVYAKWHRFRGMWDAILSLVRGTRAEREWKVALALKGFGIRAAEPLLLGLQKRWGVPMESFLVTRAVAGVSLKQLVQQSAESPVSESKRHALSRNLGELVSSLHANGVSHPDLHSDNILLVEPNAALCLLDLHAAKVRSRITRQSRVQNLAVLCNSFTRAGATLQDRVRFLKAYLEENSERDELSELSEAVRIKSQKLSARRIKSRSRRCMVRSKVYTNERTPLGRVYRQRAISLEQVKKAIALHYCTMAGEPVGAVMKRSPKTNVTLIDWDGSLDARQLCVKEFVRAGVLRLLPARVRHRPALDSWRAALGLAVRGISGAGAFAALLGKGVSSYVIMPSVQSATPLVAYVQHQLTPQIAVSRRRSFIRAAAEFLLQCYSGGVFHRDLKAGNVLVRETSAGGWEFILLDLAAVRFPCRVKPEYKLLNLAQLNASTPLQFSWTDRMRLLRQLAKQDAAFAGREAVNKIIRISRGRICLWSE